MTRSQADRDIGRRGATLLSPSCADSSFSRQARCFTPTIGFRFPGVPCWSPAAKDIRIPPILVQIGAQASLIRHICLEFPRLSQIWYEPGDRIERRDADIAYLQLILSACTGVTTLEFSLQGATSIAHAYSVFDAASKMPQGSELVEPLAMLDEQLNAVPTIRNVVIDGKM